MELGPAEEEQEEEDEEEEEEQEEEDEEKEEGSRRKTVKLRGKSSWSRGFLVLRSIGCQISWKCFFCCGHAQHRLSNLGISFVLVIVFGHA